MPNLDLRSKGSRALRKGRFSQAGHVYLVTFTTFERRPHFADFERGCLASRVLSDACLWRQSSLLAWVLMPDHWHGLVQPDGSDSLSRCVARMKSAVSRDFRRHRGHSTHLWASGFHDHALRQEEDLRSIARYVVLNPVRAGLVASAWCYPFWNAVWVEGLSQGLRGQGRSHKSSGP